MELEEIEMEEEEEEPWLNPNLPYTLGIEIKEWIEYYVCWQWPILQMARFVTVNNQLVFGTHQPSSTTCSISLSLSTYPLCMYVHYLSHEILQAN
jgi:hypothetical protein